MPDRLDLRLGQHALALVLRRAPDRGDEVDRDQIFLRRPAQRRRRARPAGGWPSITVPASTRSSRTARRSALENWSAGSDRYGLRCRRSGRIAFGSVLIRRPSRAHRLVTVEQRAERERSAERGCGSGSAGGAPLSIRSISSRRGLAGLGQVHRREMARAACGDSRRRRDSERTRCGGCCRRAGSVRAGRRHTIRPRQDGDGNGGELLGRHGRIPGAIWVQPGRYTP